MEDPTREPAPHCSRCAHYWITHQPPTPHGCRAFGLRSARLPMIEIRASSGQDCGAFEPKPARGERP